MPPRTPVERCPRSSSRAACDRRGLRRRAWALTVLGRPDFDDAWELAGDGTPGYTWSNHNPLAAFVARTTHRRHPIVVCGDFNAGPDSDELRILTGRSETPVPGLVFYDAWELAGDGTPGYTWSNHNPLAALGLYPDRRFDYILPAWPRAGGVGHPTRCELLGDTPTPEQDQLSNHYGILADLRY